MMAKQTSTKGNLAWFTHTSLHVNSDSNRYVQTAIECTW